MLNETASEMYEERAHSRCAKRLVGVNAPAQTEDLDNQWNDIVKGGV